MDFQDRIETLEDQIEALIERLDEIERRLETVEGPTVTTVSEGGIGVIPPADG